MKIMIVGRNEVELGAQLEVLRHERELVPGVCVYYLDDVMAAVTPNVAIPYGKVAEIYGEHQLSMSAQVKLHEAEIRALQEITYFGFDYADAVHGMKLEVEKTLVELATMKTHIVEHAQLVRRGRPPGAIPRDYDKRRRAKRRAQRQARRR